MELLQSTGLSKYNHQPAIDLGPHRRHRVLVVDQTAGDQSLRFGRVGKSFAEILDETLERHPDSDIFFKTHPDVLAGKRRGHAVASAPRVHLLDEPCHGPSLFAQVDHVVVATSQLGFEALVHGLPVTCHGVPWYAGWGLTEDRVPAPRRGRRRTLAEAVAIAYLRYARYVDPEHGPTTAEDVVALLDAQRRAHEAVRGRLLGVGFSLWKEGIVRDFLHGVGTHLSFAPTAAAASTHVEREAVDALVVWGSDHRADALADEKGIPIWRLEDGFLRSVGLGSNLASPRSLVLDRRGMHFDPASPSDLEELLAHREFTTSELERASALRRLIVGRRVSKYNAGERWRMPAAAAGRHVVLVIGQVEDDQSVRLGSVDVRTNRDLLRAARAARPESWIVYKPHPDVVSGNREGHVSDDEAAALADTVAASAALPDVLDAADEVHTITSLVGFEALLRAKTVVVHGRPFYAGWGLTRDRHHFARRSRRRSLDELVAATLIAYPRYLDPQTGRYETPELVVDHLASKKSAAPPRIGVRKMVAQVSNATRPVVRSLAARGREFLRG